MKDRGEQNAYRRKKEKIIDILVTELSPDYIILFGSHAKEIAEILI